MPDSADRQSRLDLSNRLLALLPTQFDQVVFVLQPAPGNIPPNTAKPGDRVAALLAWAESPIGCGLAELETVLADVLAKAEAADGTMPPASGSRRDVHIGESLDHSSVVSGDGNRVEIHHHYGLPEQKPDATRQDRNEKTLIEAVWTEVEDRLRQSLHNAILIRLDMAEQRGQVSRPWDSQLRTADQGTKTLEPSTHIADVFDRRDVGGKLLILGNPGAGKTTTMLDLAAVLIQRANDQPDEPIPVMFNLSSWQNEKQSITDWLLGELKLKYGVSPKLGKTWLTEKKLLPLLDGLDELPPQRQEPVVEAINGWLRSGEGPTRLLVCSRIEEYELYGAKLALNGAICLEPLTDQQLRDYLGSMGMGALWESLQQDAALLALVRTPLLLSVSILANEAIDAEQWRQKQTTQARMDYLLDAYVERCLHGTVENRQKRFREIFTPQQMRRQLSWLSRTLKKTSSDEFSTEKLQPSVLSNKGKKYYQITISISAGMIVGAIHWLICRIILSLTLQNISLASVNPDFIEQQLQDKLISQLIEAIYRGAAWGSFSSMLVGTSIGLKISLKSIVFTESFSLKNLRKDLAGRWFLFGIATSIGLNTSNLLAFVIAWLYSPRIFVYKMNSGRSTNPLDSAGEIYRLIFETGWKWLFVLTLIWTLFWLSFGSLRGLSRSIENKAYFGQGLHNNLRLLAPSFIIFYFQIFLVSFGCIFVLSEFNEITVKPWHINLLLLLCAALMSGVSVGLPCAQHLILRLLLCNSEGTPWNYARFLNHCTDRLLLQRVGGRYRFIHKLVQEHFAAMPLSR